MEYLTPETGFHSPDLLVSGALSSPGSETLWMTPVRLLDLLLGSWRQSAEMIHPGASPAACRCFH